MQPQVFRGGSRQQQKTEADQEAFIGLVERNYERIQREHQASEYSLPGDMDERAIMRQALAEAQRTTGFRDVLRKEVFGELTEEDAAQAGLDFFPPKPSQQTGVVAPGKQRQAGYDISEQDIVGIDNALSAQFENLPYEVTQTDDLNLALRLSSGAVVPGAIVPGYEVPVAVSATDEQSEYYERLGVPYVKRGTPHEVIDRGVSIEPRQGFEVEEFDEPAAYQSSLDTVSSDAEKMLKDAAKFDEDKKEYDIESAKNVLERDTRITAPQKPDGYGLYEQALNARNQYLQDNFDIATEGAFDPDLDLAKNDLNQAMQRPITSYELEQYMIESGKAAELVQRERIQHAQVQQRRLDLHRQQNHDYSSQYDSLYTTSLSNGQYVYKAKNLSQRRGPTAFEPKALPALRFGPNRYRMPVISSVTDVAHVGFGAPVMFMSNNEVNMVTIKNGPVQNNGQTIRGLSSYGGSINDSKKLSQNIRDIAMNIDAQIPVTVSKTDLLMATYSMMRRLGYTGEDFTQTETRN